MKTATKVLMMASLLSTGCGDGVDPVGTGGTGVGIGGNAAMPPPGAGGTWVQPPEGAGGTWVAPGTGGGTGVVDGTGGSDPDICIPGVPTTSQIPRLLNREYDAAVYELLGVEALGNGQMPSEVLNSDYSGPINTYAWNAYVNVGEEIAAQVMAGADISSFMACDPEVTASCYEDTIRTFGRKVFRRPLTEEEVTRFMSLTTIEPAGTAAEISEAILFAFLVSPSFIMLPELEPTVEGAAFMLSSHEVATRLSLMLWGSIPDEILSTAADNGELATKEQILAQAQRMLLDRDRAGAQIAAAHQTYLGMDAGDSHWWKVRQDKEKFPLYDEAAIPAMKAELDAFFEDIAYEGGSFEDMFLSSKAFVNEDTAAFYGLNPADYGADLTPVDLDPAQRPGFLTRAGFLSSFSSFDATSPILRGAFVTVKIIGVDPGAPDPDAAKTPIPDGTYTTRRGQIEKLTEPPACKKCHGEFVNPPGFVLESYDAIGNWQTVDALGGDIDATATVSFTDTNVVPISTPLAMMEQIAANPKSKRIYVEKLVSFATGRLPNSNDACLVGDLDTKLAGDGYTVLNLLADLTQAESFRLRTAEN